MKTSMLGETARRRLAARWGEAMARGVADAEGRSLAPGDLVALPACVTAGTGSAVEVPGTVLGYALDKAGAPSVVVHAAARRDGKRERWRTWVVGGGTCRMVGEAQAEALAKASGALAAGDGVLGAQQRQAVASGWLPLVLGGARTRGGVAVAVGDLVRLPRSVARSRGSQLRAAGTCLGYAVGADGGACVVVDAVGEDSPTTLRWRTWLARPADVLVITTKEAWRLERRYYGRA